MANDVPQPSPHDTLLVHNPLKQPFTIEYEHRMWTIDANETVGHPRHLAVQIAGQMATAVINRMGDVVRTRIEKNNPQISVPDLQTELLKREPRTNNLELREKIIRKVIVGVEKLYPMEAQRPLDPKREAAITGVGDYYSADEKIIMKITNAEYARLAGFGAEEGAAQSTSKITTDISEFMEENVPEQKPKPTVKLEELPEEKEQKQEKSAKSKKEEDELFKEVMA